MASQKALYWIAVALMILFLGNHFAIKYDRCLRISIQSSPVLAMVERTLERTPDFASQQRLTPAVEAGFASMQAKMAHQQAAYAILAAERARMMAIEQIEQGRVGAICPRRGVRIAIPERPVASDGSI
jgi:hypothetical protein